MKKLVILYGLLFSLPGYSQFGINTSTPKATLEVVGKPTITTEPDGAIVPRLTGDQLKEKDAAYTTDQTGTIVYVTLAVTVPSTKTAKVTNAGYYYFSGTRWITMATENKYTVGDIKTGIQPNDHDGWIKLDGRLTSSLTATQQSQAVLLGIGLNLPNANNSYLVQNGTILGTVSGSNTVTLLQSNLPNISFAGTTDVSGSHSHSGFSSPHATSIFGEGTVAPSNPFNVSGGGIMRRFPLSSFATSTDGSHSHTVNINTGGSSTPINIQPQSLSVNTFIYLGD